MGTLLGECELVSVGGNRAVNITGLTGAVRYPGSLLNSSEGTIAFRWMPPPGLVEFYTANRSEWKTYTYGDRVYRPPKGGFLLDQIAWFPAKPGCSTSPSTS